MRRLGIRTGSVLALERRSEMRQMATWIAVAACLAWGSSCARTTPSAGPQKLAVVVTIPPHAWLVEQVGGDRVEVLALVRPGETAETYQPTDAEISQVARSAVYFRAGMPLERSRTFRVLESERGLKVVDLRQGIELAAMDHAHDQESPAHDEDPTPSAADPWEGKDPHVWLSPRLLAIQARTVADTLAAIDPAHEAEYRGRLDALRSRLDALDRSLAERLRPYRGKAMFVFHPAWGYFAREYGLRQVAIESEGKEPSDQELTNLQREARQDGAKVIFVQRQVASRSAEALARAIGGRIEPLDDLAADVATALERTAQLIEESYR